MTDHETFVPRRWMEGAEFRPEPENGDLAAFLAEMDEGPFLTADRRWVSRGEYFEHLMQDEKVRATVDRFLTGERLRTWNPTEAWNRYATTPSEAQQSP